MKVALALKGAEWAMNFTAARYPAFAARLAGRARVVQLRMRDPAGPARHYAFGAKRVRSGAGLHAKPDVVLTFKDEDVAWRVFKPGSKRADAVNFAKNFSVEVTGDDELACWFTETLSLMQSVRWKLGVDAGHGETRYVNATNAGPVFVYVKDGKIVRMTPIDFDEQRPALVVDRGAREGVLAAAPHDHDRAHARVEVDGRLEGPAADADEARRLRPGRRAQLREPRQVGLCADQLGRGARHRRVGDPARQAGARPRRDHEQPQLAPHLGQHRLLRLSAFNRFMNAIGYTKMVINPDSWEGWYWGATHHYGYSMRLGAAEPYGMLDDCLQQAELIVFWSSDPESTGGSYGAFEGTLRRMFARDVGIEMVHIDPHLNPTASLLGGKWIPIVPGTDPALAHAIAHVWMTEGLYDKAYVAERTTGFDKYRDYVLGIEDGVPKSPEWQEPETGVPAFTVRALARKWGTRRTYLGAGGKGTAFGGACRSATGSQWARAMVCLMAMQGLGKPGVNFGNLQYGAPIDYNFYFPGYGEGGLSGDVETTGAAVQLYQRQPQLPSMNVVAQRITRNRIAEAILDGETHGHPIDPKSINGQFMRFHYPAPGHSRVRMMYKYGGSHFGTVQESNRLADAYRSSELEFVVNQSIWHEGESKFADVILPACTNFERWDIGEWTVAGGYSHHNNGQLNHRVISIQHKCIEPLGESRSDYQIFLSIMHRLGMGTYYSEGMTELDWCRAQFEASDLPGRISWEDFLEKGYYVVPPEDTAKTPQPVAMRWFAEGRRKDVPEPHPLPAGYGTTFREGLQTMSGKIEFEPSSLKMFDDPGRPPVNRYIPSWEGRGTTELYGRFPLQLVTPHPRYSFHTHTDGKDTFINDVEEHRVLIDGYYYWVARMNPRDADARRIAHHDLVRLHNDRGSVICAAALTERLAPGVVQAYASSAVYDPIGEPGRSPDRGGCVNTLAPTRWQTEKTSASAPNSCLIEVEKEPMATRRASGNMTGKWALFIDVAKCHNCRNCYIACKDEHVGNAYPGYAAPQPRHGHDWIAISTRERGAAPMVDVAHLPTTCNHCEDAPCVTASPDGAVYRRPDGIVMIDPDKARGKREIVDTCPYGAIWWNEDERLPQKWIFDAHLLDRGWKEPRCVQACPTAAMTSAKLDDAALAARVADEGWETLHPEYGTRPRVFYRNLHRYVACFVGGTLVAQANGVDDCVAGAKVEVSKDGRVVASAMSDDFGEFKVDGLGEDSGAHAVLVRANGYRDARTTVTLGASRYLGIVRLERA